MVTERMQKMVLIEGMLTPEQAERGGFVQQIKEVFFDYVTPKVGAPTNW